MKLIFFTAAFFSFLPNGYAAPFKCLPGETLYKEINVCEQNPLLSEAARQCLDLLAAEVYVVSGERESFAQLQRDLRNSNAQDKSLKTGETQYKKAADRFELLIISGEMLTSQVHGYLDFLTWPEDSDEPSITGPRLNDFLMGSDCYADAKKKIKRAEQVLSTMTSQLRNARSAVAQLREATAGNKSNVGAISSSNTNVVKTNSPPVEETKKITTIDEALMGIDLRGGGISGPRSEQKK